MKGILISPFDQTVGFIEFTDNLDEYYRILGTDGGPFDVRTLDEGVVMFVDDEGLYKRPQRFFRLEGSPDTWAGKALITGVDEEGNTTSIRPELEDLELTSRLITWCPPTMEFVGIESTEDTVSVPWSDKPVRRLVQRPVFRGE